MSIQSSSAGYRAHRTTDDAQHIQMLVLMNATILVATPISAIGAW